MSGVVFYEGPSTIDGQPIVGIFTFGSKNSKTGNLIQSWILRSDIEPLTAIHNGSDESICGSCPLRGILVDNVNKERGCYVAVHTAPYQIYKCYKKGGYSTYDSSMKDMFKGSKVRLGSYGDPVAIPLYVWKRYIDLCDGQTGYTHQWKDGRYWRWRKYIMASTHSIEENELAKSKGWRTFRTVTSLSEQSKTEIVCPASAERGYIRTCETCMACNGTNGNSSRRDIVIIGHGRKAVTGPLIRTIERIKNGV